MLDSTEQNEAPPLVVAKRPRHRIIIDHATGTLEHDGGVYRLDTIPEATRDHLALTYLGLRMAAASDPAAAFRAVASGNAGRRGGNRNSPIREAIALALGERAKKRGVVLTVEDARARALAIDPKAVAIHARDPLVAKHFAKLSGVESSLDDMLA